MLQLTATLAPNLIPDRFRLFGIDVEKTDLTPRECSIPPMENAAIRDWKPAARKGREWRMIASFSEWEICGGRFRHAAVIKV